jgi:hypothetical protein
MKTLNKQLHNALRPIKQELRQPPKRILIAKVRETEADEWIGFIGRNTDIIPLRLKK